MRSADSPRRCPGELGLHASYAGSLGYRHGRRRAVVGDRGLHRIPACDRVHSGSGCDICGDDTLHAVDAWVGVSLGRTHSGCRPTPIRAWRRQYACWNNCAMNKPMTLLPCAPPTGGHALRARVLRSRLCAQRLITMSCRRVWASGTHGGPEHGEQPLVPVFPTCPFRARSAM